MATSRRASALCAALCTATLVTLAGAVLPNTTSPDCTRRGADWLRVARVAGWEEDGVAALVVLRAGGGVEDDLEVAIA